MLKILKPTTRMYAFDHAKWQDEENNVMVKLSNSLPRRNFSCEAIKIANKVSSKPYNHSKVEIMKGPKYHYERLHDQI